MSPTIAFDYNTAGALTQPEACYYSKNTRKSGIQEYSNRLLQNQENWLLDIDSELEIYFSGHGKVKFEFFRASIVIKIKKVICSYLL